MQAIRKWAELQVLETLVSNIDIALQNQKHSVPHSAECLSPGQNAKAFRSRSVRQVY